MEAICTSETSVNLRLTARHPIPEDRTLRRDGTGCRHTGAALYRVFRAQADWTSNHTSHKDTEQSTIEASITLDGVTLTDPLIG
jgi:hypothetical protein